MLAFVRRNTIALIALTLALGGTAYAANTVRSADIVDGTIKAVDIANFAVNPDKTTGLWNYHNTAVVKTSDCATSAQTWKACAYLQFSVPAGHVYDFQVISTVNVYAPSDMWLAFCAAGTGPSCLMGTYDNASLPAGKYTSVSNSAAASYGPGAYTFSTAVKFQNALPDNAHAHTTTVLTVTDRPNLLPH